VQLPRRMLLGALPVICLQAACTSTSDDADITALDRLQRQVDSAITAADIDRYLMLLSDDAVLMPPNGAPIVGKSAIGSWNESMADQFRIASYSSVDDEVIVAGDWAFRRASFDWTVVPARGGQTLRDSGKYLIVYRRHPDGSWRVARDIWNSNTRAP
jgi:ketosteroid isomerase-like protein